MFDAPRENEFTQGTVFSCAYAEDYTKSSVYGLVITARCDAAQDKTPIYSYIPVVSLHDWMLYDGCNIVADRIHSECKGNLKKYLKDAALSESLLNTKTIDEIYESHFRPNEHEKAWKDRCTKIKSTMDSFTKNCRIKTSAFDIEERKRHLVKNLPKTDTVIKELSGHRLSGFYFLSQMPTLGGTDADCVALLREIHHIPKGLMQQIVSGLTSEAWETGPKGNMRCPQFVGEDDLSAPVAKLKSPWIEHLMQHFTMLFARIGVIDNDFASIKKSLSPIGLG